MVLRNVGVLTAAIHVTIQTTSKWDSSVVMGSNGSLEIGFSD